jgi:hypothetical protein
LRAQGVVVAVDGAELARVNGFSLRRPGGETLRFEVQALALSDGGKPAPHLREHMASGEPIEVEYRVEDGRLVAIRYSDVP